MLAALGLGARPAPPAGSGGAHPPKVSGLYIAWHPWLDLPEGPGSINKVGHSGNLAGRLNNDCYITCFPKGWVYRATLETKDKAAAFLLETAVLHCLKARRIDGRELVRYPAEDILALAKKVAGELGLPVAERREPAYDPPARHKTPQSDKPPPDAARNGPSGVSSAEASPDFGEPERQKIQALVVQEQTMDDFLSGLIEGITDPTDLASAPSSGPAPKPSPPAKTLPAPPEPAVVTGGAPPAAAPADEENDLSLDDFDFLDLLDPADPVAALEDREYQREAARRCLEELERSGRTILQMACRCGKTKIAHEILQATLQKNGAVLYLVPGLPLLRQTIAKLWGYGGLESAELVLVGSDPRSVDLTSVSGARTSLTMTTNPADVERRRESASEAGRPFLVVCTYQSSAQVRDTYDLTVFDECHRICGGKAPRPFNHVLLRHARGRRLYMTATPRHDTAVSMRDRALFGGVAYRYHLRKGIQAGYVNDFTVELVDCAAGPAIPPPDPGPDPAPLASSPPAPHPVVIAMRSLSARVKDAKMLVFCRDIRHAVDLCAEVRAAAAALPEEVRFECTTAHSRMPSREVGARLTRFAAPGVRAVLFNCRLFQEGVEIPALNAVYFAAPRHSPRDIIQSLCRPLNKAPGKPVSTVFLPIEAPAAETAEDVAARPAEDLRRFASILPFADALMSEDPRFYEHLLDPRGKPFPLGWVGAHGEGVALLAAARKAMRYGARSGANTWSENAERLMKAETLCSTAWETAFGELRRIVAECRRYPKTTDAFHLGTGQMCFHQFYQHCIRQWQLGEAGRKCSLEPHQLRDLEGLPEWRTRGVEGPYPWRESLDFLEGWLRDHGGGPPMVEINRGGFIGLSATPMERLSGVLTTVNQSDGRDRKTGGKRRPGSGFTLAEHKQRDLDALCAKYKLRWRKERLPNPEDPAKPGSLRENEKGEYIGAPSFVQEAYDRFKTEVKKEGQGSAYIRQWFPGYFEGKHDHQEELDVWKRHKELCPPKWRGRGT